MYPNESRPSRKDLTDDDGEERTGETAGATGARRSHVPDDGTAEAAAVERARKGMLHEARDLKRTRIGADVLCEALLRQGVDVFFSYPGGVILPLYDVLGDYPELRHILVRHEQGGAHAADGYARVTGRVGVCMGTSGPGATNLVTGIGTALLDSIPMVAITGNVPAALIGKDAFQEIDINGITLPMTKHNYLVRDADELPARHRRGLPHRPDRPARPGPHRHHQGRAPAGDARRASRPRTRSSPGLPGFRPNMDGHPRQLKLAAAEIAKAERPVILAGHGVLHAEAWDELLAFAEKTQIPVAWTLLGIGAIDETHPLAYGYMGMHGWKHVNRAIQSADLLIAIGMRFDDRVTGNVRTYAPYARIIHVDIDPAEIGKNVAVEVPIVGDAKRVLTGAHPPGRAGRAGDAQGVPRPARRVEDRLGGLVVARLRRVARRAPLRGLRRRADRRAVGARGDLRRGRRAEPDVARPLHRVPPAEQPRQLGRPRDDGLQRARRRWAPRSAGPTARPGRSPATAGSR